MFHSEIPLLRNSLLNDPFALKIAAFDLRDTFILRLNIVMEDHWISWRIIRMSVIIQNANITGSPMLYFDKLDVQMYIQVKMVTMVTQLNSNHFSA